MTAAAAVASAHDAYRDRLVALADGGVLIEAIALAGRGGLDADLGSLRPRPRPRTRRSSTTPAATRGRSSRSRSSSRARRRPPTPSCTTTRSAGCASSRSRPTRCCHVAGVAGRVHTADRRALPAGAPLHDPCRPRAGATQYAKVFAEPTMAERVHRVHRAVGARRSAASSASRSPGPPASTGGSARLGQKPSPGRRSTRALFGDGDIGLAMRMGRAAGSLTRTHMRPRAVLDARVQMELSQRRGRRARPARARVATCNRGALRPAATRARRRGPALAAAGARRAAPAPVARRRRRASRWSTSTGSRSASRNGTPRRSSPLWRPRTARACPSSG